MNPKLPEKDPRDLGHRQRLFPVLVARLINRIYDSGYEVTFGETYRTAQAAQANAAAGRGIVHSLHTQRLAIDLQLFKDGAYLSGAEPYKQFADYWLTLDPLCAAGYYFKSVDADHFSITYLGTM